MRRLCTAVFLALLFSAGATAQDIITTQAGNGVPGFSGDGG